MLSIPSTSTYASQATYPPSFPSTPFSYSTHHLSAPATPSPSPRRSPRPSTSPATVELERQRDRITELERDLQMSREERDELARLLQEARGEIELGRTRERALQERLAALTEERRAEEVLAIEAKGSTLAVRSRSSSFQLVDAEEAALDAEILHLSSSSASSRSTPVAKSTQQVTQLNERGSAVLNEGRADHSSGNEDSADDNGSDFEVLEQGVNGV